MSAPKVTVVTEASPAARAGLLVGDELVSLNGRQPRDVIEYQQLADAGELDVVVRRGGEEPPGHRCARRPGEPLGLEVSSAVFDRVRTCDNHCAFCFIYQLPKGMRRSLYLKDDDYRLSFLYGNFTTLTRFTELDAERVLDERLGPLFVSIHATDPGRAGRDAAQPQGRHQPALAEGPAGGRHRDPRPGGGLSRGERRGGPGGHLCRDPRRVPATGHRGRGAARSQPLLQRARDAAPHPGRGGGGLRDRRPLAGGLPLGARPAPGLRRRRVLPDGRPPASRRRRPTTASPSTRTGSAWSGPSTEPSGATTPPPRGCGTASSPGSTAPRPRATAPPAWSAAGGAPGADARPVTVLTGTYGAQVLAPLLAGPDVRILAVENDFFGGNIGVAGLLTGADLARALAAEPDDHRYLLPDACLSEGRFLDGLTLADLPRGRGGPPTAGAACRTGRPPVPARSALDARGAGSTRPRGGGGRPPQRREVLAGQPDRRPPGGGGRGGAGGDPGPQGARRRVERRALPAWSTPAAGWPAATPSTPR